MEIQWNGAALVGAVAAACDRAVWEGAEALLAESGKEVPHDEGTLELSGQVDKIAPGVCVVSYGKGEAAAYAIRQHEDLSLNHQRGRKAKYLEDLAIRLTPTIINHIASAVSKAVGGG